MQIPMFSRKVKLPRQGVGTCFTESLSEDVVAVDDAAVRVAEVGPRLLHSLRHHLELVDHNRVLKPPSSFKTR